MEPDRPTLGRSGSQLRRVLVAGGTLVALVVAVGLGSRVIGFSSGWTLLAAALATPTFIAYVLVATPPRRDGE